MSSILFLHFILSFRVYIRCSFDMMVGNGATEDAAGI